MKKKVLTYYVILIALAISIAGLFLARITRETYKDDGETLLLSSARLIRHHIDSDCQRGLTPDYSCMAKGYASLLNAGKTNPDYADLRVTFIDYTGMVLGESDVNTDLLHMENHKDREEVAQAISGSTGKAMRISRTTGVESMYIAIPYETHHTIIRIALPLSYLGIMNKRIALYTVFGIAGALLLTFLAAWVFTCFAMEPLDRFVEMTSDIARGNYDKRIKPPEGNNELAKLSVSFNRMAEELESTINDLKERNESIRLVLNNINDGIIALDRDQKVTFMNPVAVHLFSVPENLQEGRNILSFIQNASLDRLIRETYRDKIPKSGEIKTGQPNNRFLQVYTTLLHPIGNQDEVAGVIVTLQDVTGITKLQRMRTEFVSNVTHELKTPLTSIRGFIETLRNGAIDDKEVARQFLDIIDIEAERLYTLINDIMQLSEIESMKKDIHIGEYRLRSLFLDILPVLQKVAEEKNIKIYEDIDPDITIKANANRIMQLFMNLTDNAIKYNRNNGEVRVQARKEEGTVVIKVKDNGIGIPEEHHERIFERFYRVDKGRSRNQGGTGLGLSIIKHIVSLYNGDIKLTSRPGEGTEFVIRLPL